MPFEKEEQKFEIVLGRDEVDRKKFGTRGTVLVGKHYVKMAQVTALSQPVYMDLNKAHVVFVCGKRGCLTKETKVFTNHGFKCITDFDNKIDMVWSFNVETKAFEWCRAELWRYSVDKKEELIEIKLHDGQKLTMTAEHPLLINQDGQFAWRQAKDLKVNDEILSTAHVPEVKNDVATARVARLLGFILSDGTIGVRHGRWMDGRGHFYNGTRKRIRVFNNVPEVLEQAKTDFDEEFKIKSRRYKRNDCNCEVVETNQQVIANKFIELGVPPGEKSKIIRVPKVVWSHSNNFKAAFLKALFSCDGFVSKNQNGRRIMYYSNSKEFLVDLQLLLLHFNVQSRVRSKKTSCNGKRFVSYVLDITDYKSLQLWKEHIQFFGTDKNERLNSFKFWRMSRRKKTKYFDNDLYTNKICSVSSISGVTEVFDLHVPETHSFIANGVISHNTGKSYSLGVIAEGIATLPVEFSQKLSVILFDTMGIYWTMKYPNHKDESLLHEWGFEGKGIDAVKIYTPFGFFKSYKEQGIPTDVAFAIKPSELQPDDWNVTFELATNDPIAVFIERVVLNLKKQKSDYDIQDILTTIRADLKEEVRIKNAAENRFLAADSWGVFGKDATPMKDLIQGGQISIIDLSCYATMANAWKIKTLVTGLVCKRVFIERMIARKNEEFAAIHSAVHYIVEAEKPSELPMVWLMVDEAHEFLPKEGKTGSSDALIMLLREGRQPGIAMLLATQQPGKIHTDAMTQSDIILAHRLTAKIDTDALASLLQSYLRGHLDVELDNLPKLAGACIALDDVNERMFPMRVRPRFSWHGGSAPSIVKEGRKFEL